MIWQDLVLAAGSLFFFIALLPSIFSAKKPHWASSLITGSILIVFSVVDVTLGLYYAAGMNVLSAVAWFVLFVQRVRKDRSGSQDD